MAPSIEQEVVFNIERQEVSPPKHPLTVSQEEQGYIDDLEVSFRGQLERIYNNHVNRDIWSVRVENPLENLKWRQEGNHKFFHKVKLAPEKRFDDKYLTFSSISYMPFATDYNLVEGRAYMSIEIGAEEACVVLNSVYTHLEERSHPQSILGDAKDWRMGFGKYQLYSKRERGLLKHFKGRKKEIPSLIIGVDITDTGVGRKLLENRGF